MSGTVLVASWRTTPQTTYLLWKIKYLVYFRSSLSLRTGSGVLNDHRLDQDVVVERLNDTERWRWRVGTVSGPHGDFSTSVFLLTRKTGSCSDSLFVAGLRSTPGRRCRWARGSSSWIEAKTQHVRERLPEGRVKGSHGKSRSVKYLK